MGLNKRVLLHEEAAAADGDAAASAEQNLIIHLDANDVDSTDGDDNYWYDISEHDVTIPLSDNADDLELHLNASDTTSYDPATDTTTWTDISDNTNDATLVSMTNTNHDFDNGGYFTLDGANDYATLSYDASLYMTSNTGFTIEAWVNRDDNNEGYIISSADGTNYPYSLSWNGSTNGYYGWISGSSYSGSTTVGAGDTTSNGVGNWDHVVMTQSSSDRKNRLYVNGELTSTSTSAASGFHSTSSGVNIGAYHNLANKFDGKMSAVRIYSKQLSASEIGQNYRHGRDVLYTSLIADTNLKIHQDAASYSGSGSTWTADVGTDFTLSVSSNSYNQELGDFFDFNGTTDFAHRTATATSPLDFSAKGYTIEAWINKDDTDYNYVLAKYGTSDSNRSFIFGVANDDKVILFERSSSSNTLKSTSTVSTNKWIHIAVVRSSSDAKFYINGELDNTVSSTFTPNNGGTQRITIGKHESTTPSFFNGQIGQVRVYGEELSVDDIRQNFNFTKNDYPNEFHFTRYGATFDTSTHTSPDVDAYSLDGSNDYFDNTTFNINLGTVDYTLSAWIYVQGALSGSGGYVIMGTYASSAGMWLDVIKSSGKLRLYQTGGTTVNQQSTGTVSQNTWHHVICVRDRVNGKVNFFIDGVAAGSTTIAAANGSDDGTGFEIGRYNSGYYFNGDIAQVKVFDSAMTTSEAQSLFNQNATTFGKTEV